MDKLEGQVYGDYKLGKLIGKGTYGHVYRARRILKNGRATSTVFADEELAIKLIDIQNSNARHWEMVEREIEVLQRAEEKKHPNIVSFYGHFKHNGVPCLVMEYCGGGTLYQKIRDLKTEGKFIKEEDFMSYLTQIASAVEVLHGMDIIHRDLKTKNIMLTADGHCKIGDFGVAKVIEIAGINTKGIGTPFYMCPEVIQGIPYDQKADVWSLGCTCYEMATGCYAFDGKSVQEINAVVKSGKIPETTKIQYSDEIKNLIIQMLSYNGASRPTIGGVLRFVEDYKEKGAKSKKSKSKKSKRHKDETTSTTSSIDTSLKLQESSASIASRFDSRKASDNKAFLEKESAKLQATLVMEIKSHKAADIVSYIKNLQKRGLSEREFKEKVLKYLDKDMFYKLYPVMKAMKCIEDGRREIQTSLNMEPDASTMLISTVDLQDD